MICKAPHCRQRPRFLTAPAGAETVEPHAVQGNVTDLFSPSFKIPALPSASRRSSKLSEITTRRPHPSREIDDDYLTNR